ncbi:hypothetical protein IQ07DRAFT_581879 [Pyrenochaeta sp. DS3sAY3a]|nr:hypothetical protein IQ07DRAFT_581879 [Pyrenochaeta sp. DS3sAY3a]
MQSSTILVNTHSESCPKCGAAFSGSTKTCGSCGSVSHSNILVYLHFFEIYTNVAVQSCPV